MPITLSGQNDNTGMNMGPAVPLQNSNVAPQINSSPAYQPSIPNGLLQYGYDPNGAVGFLGDSITSPNQTRPTLTPAQQQQAKEVDSTRALLDTRAGALRGLLGQVGTTRQQGLEQLSDTYNTDKQSAAQKYGLQRTDNAQGRVKALDQVDTGARTGANGLRRLLGLSGSANQSAMGVAMNAVARDASGKRQGQIDTFGRNERDITGAETDYMTRLDQEKKTKESSFLRDLLQQKSDIEAQIGDTEMQKAALNGANYEGIRAAYAPYQALIDQGNTEINGLYEKYKTPFTEKANDVSLGQYTVDKSAINAQKQGGGEYAPYDQFLAKRKLQDNGGL